MEKKGILDFLHFRHPTEEQAIVLREMEQFVAPENPMDFIILCGAAGTGKTSITAALIGFLGHLNQPYRISAPTGRAARILGRKANTTTSTIHAMIYAPSTDRESGKVTFKLKHGNNAKPTIYIIDEASMVSKEVDQEATLFKVERGLIFDLIAYIKGANSENKIIFIGDRYQLPPIGEDTSHALEKKFLEDTFNLRGSEFRLEEVKRQEDGSYILENATEIRKAIDANVTTHPIIGTKSKDIYAAVANYVQGLNSNGPESSIVIGVSHRSNSYFNDLTRNRVFGKAKNILEPRDLLLVIQNWQRGGAHLYNGDHVELVSVDWSIQEQVAGLHFVPVRVKLLFSEKEVEIEDYAMIDTLLSPGGKIDSKLENELRRQRYTKNRIFQETGIPSDDRYVGALRLMYGHAITCNKAQGGEWKKVYVNTWGIPSLKWQYTAITRGIEEIERF
jgi:exodeoxyribonuclease-5